MVQEIILAAGCFWSVQYKFNKLKGVEETYVVYAGGQVEHPTYAQVCTGKTGHAEAVYIKYNDEILTTRDLINFFFQIHDASQYQRQGPDIGSQYRSAIFYFTEEQKNIALKVKSIVQQSNYYKNLPIVTEIASITCYYMAEEFHQHYYQKKGF